MEHMWISIITAVRNRKDTLMDTVKSLCHQTLERVEHVIIDGMSIDGTQEVIRECGRLYGGARKLRWVSEPDRGIYDALNKGIRLASGDIVGVLHADDFYAHNRVLETVLDVFEKEKVDSCYGDLIYVDKKDPETVVRYWKASGYSRGRLKNGWMPPHPTFFVRREIYERYGFYNLDLGSAADYELMLRFLFRYEISCAYIPEVMVKMRTGGASNASLRNRIRANLMDRKAWKVNGLKPYPWTLWVKPLRKLPQFLFFHRGILPKSAQS